MLMSNTIRHKIKDGNEFYPLLASYIAIGGFKAAQNELHCVMTLEKFASYVYFYTHLDLRAKELVMYKHPTSQCIVSLQNRC